MKRKITISRALPEHLRGGAEYLNSERMQDQLRVGWIAQAILRRSVDPDGRNEPIAAVVAAKLQRCVADPDEAAEILNLAAMGVLPDGFLNTLQRLAARPAESSRQCSYLTALLHFRLAENRWPYAAEADRYAAAMFPQSFAGCGEPATDGKDTFKRLRRTLCLPWLPKGTTGRRRK